MSVFSDRYQRDNASVLLRVGHELLATELALLAMMELGWGENDMHASGCNSSGHCGLFQLSTTLQAEHDYRDVAYWARRAYQDGFWSHGGIIPLSLAHPNWGPGYITNLCQGAYSDLTAGGQYYDRYRSTAEETLRELGHTVTGGPPPGPVGHEPLAAYDPSTIIRHDFFQFGEYGTRAYAHANQTRRLLNGVRHCTFKRPVR